jgi:prepilin-type N-terminal cleavage/methylation domain-containing protein
MGKGSNGFTLVELATVLVIVGLLLGGLVKGHEMITQANIKNIIADFSGLSIAYYGYRDRHRAIPGDDPGAGTRWAGATSGDGNGQVAGAYNSGAAADESRLWWDHLRRAGLVAGTGTQQPINAVTGMIGVQAGDAAAPAAGPALGTDEEGAGGFAGLIACAANLPDKIAFAVDAQMDDGVPMSGTVRGQVQTTANPAIAKRASSAYVETGTHTYTICRAF